MPTPRTRCARSGANAAQRPKAPSTWTQAPASCAWAAICSMGSNAPVFTLPAWAQTIVGPEIVGSASARIRPWPSAGTRTTRCLPSPSRPRLFNSDGWTSSPTMTVTGGASKSPFSSTSHPARASTAWRAAASAVRLAIVPPVTKPATVVDGRPKSSTSQRCATCSSVAATGEAVKAPAFWSHAVASQSAATATGCEPPMTNPKNLGPAVAMVAGEPASSSNAITRSGSEGPAGSASSKRSRPMSASTSGATLRSGSSLRYRSARSAVVRSRSSFMSAPQSTGAVESSCAIR